jgi:hypothetical protein
MVYHASGSTASTASKDASSEIAGLCVVRVPTAWARDDYAAARTLVRVCVGDHNRLEWLVEGGAAGDVLEKGTRKGLKRAGASKRGRPAGNKKGGRGKGIASGAKAGARGAGAKRRRKEVETETSSDEDDGDDDDDDDDDDDEWSGGE